MGCCQSSESAPGASGRSVEEARPTPRDRWVSKWHDALKVVARRFPDQHQKDVAFTVLLRLYAHRDVAQQLYECYDAVPRDFEFYLPQLVNFLIYGAFEGSEPLEVFLLDKCEKSIAFAHRTLWFVRAFLADKPYSSEMCGAVEKPGTLARSSLLSAVESQGVRSVPRWERFVAETDEAAAALAREATAAGRALPHTALPHGGSATIAGSRENFMAVPGFVTDLTRFADSLRSEPVESRKEQLRKHLDHLNHTLLSDGQVLYLPAAGFSNRLVRLVPQESFCFRTKERVPLFVTAEVIDYDAVATLMATRHAPDGVHSSSLLGDIRHGLAEVAYTLRRVGDDFREGSAHAQGEEAHAATAGGPGRPRSGRRPMAAAAAAASSTPPADAYAPMGSASSDEHADRDDALPEQARSEARASSRRARRGRRHPRRYPRAEGDDSTASEDTGVEVKAGAASLSGGELEEGRRTSWAHEAGMRVTAAWGGARRAMVRPFRPGHSGSSAGKSEVEGGSDAHSGGRSAGWRTPAAGATPPGETDKRLAAMGQWVTPNERRSYRRRLQLRRRGEMQARRKRALGQGRGRGGAEPKRRARQGSMSKLRRGLLSDSESPIADHHAVAKVLEQHGRSDTHGSLGGYLAEGEGAGPRPAGVPQYADARDRGGSLSSTSTAPTVEPLSPASSPVRPRLESQGGDGTPTAARGGGGVRRGWESEDAEAHIVDALDAAAEMTDTEGESEEGSAGSSRRVSLSLDGDDAADVDAAVAGSGAGGSAAPLGEEGEATAPIPTGGRRARVGSQSSDGAQTASMCGGTPPEPGPYASEGYRPVAESEGPDGTMHIGRVETYGSFDASEPLHEQRVGGGNGPLLPPSLSDVHTSGSDAAARADAEGEEGEVDEVKGSGAPEGAERGGAAAAQHKQGGASPGRDALIVFHERWKTKEARIRLSSPFGRMAGWRLVPFIVKSHDDLRQEQIAAQLLKQFTDIFKEEKVGVWMRPYEIVATSTDAGLVEAIPDTISIDALRRTHPACPSLDEFYRSHFANMPGGIARAKRNFVRSLAAYSIVCYLLQIKDRHNGNILVDADGHILHIDFGFLFTSSPGGNMQFERAPFKLTTEYIDLLGGPRSRMFRRFRALCIRAFLAARKHRDKIILLVDMMLNGNKDLPCFQRGREAVMSGLKERFRSDLSATECVEYVNHLVELSNNNWRTRFYDKYQYCCLGIF